MVNSVGINNKYYTSEPALQHPVVSGMSNTLEKTPAQDEVIIQPKKKKLSTAAKVGIGLTGVLGALIGTCVLVSRHQTGKLKKLYQEKLVLSNLPEKLEFQEAKTLDEALKFAKDTLKIPEVDNNFTLEALNFANRGLVDVANANKGKLFLPKKLQFENSNDNTIAYVVRSIESKDFGNLCINSKYFDNKALEEWIKKVLYFKDGKAMFQFKNGQLITHSVGDFFPIPDKNLSDLIKKYYQNPELLNNEDRRVLWYSLDNGLNKMYGKSKGIKETVKYNLETTHPRHTIYHELGHLQDYAENLKKLDIMQWEFNLKKVWKEAIENAKAGKGKTDRIGVQEVDNRWNRGNQEDMAKLLKENPEKFKKKYPDLHEFLTNKEIQETAGEVSSYAQSGIGEFVAECYAEMIAGKKLPDKVMELYKKYNGPVVG